MGKHTRQGGRAEGGRETGKRVRCVGKGERRESASRKRAPEAAFWRVLCLTFWKMRPRT